MAFKSLEWIGDSLECVRTFAAAAAQGDRLRAVGDPTRRVIYVATLPEAVYVLHAFAKQSRKAPKSDVELARNRFRALIHERGR